MNADRVMDNIRNAFEQSGITLNELGEGLGYDGPTAKKRAWDGGWLTLSCGINRSAGWNAIPSPMRHLSRFQAKPFCLWLSREHRIKWFVSF